jgi:hypothetical protein
VLPGFAQKDKREEEKRRFNHREYRGNFICRIRLKKQKKLEYSPLLVYTGNMANKKKTGKTDRIASPQIAYNAGASDLSLKFDKKLLRKQDIIEFKREDERWENIVEMYSQVKDIDDEQGIVYLNCKYKKDTDENFERIFPLKHFKNKDKLQVDQSIIVRVLEKPGEVRFLFEEADEDFFDQDLEDISLNDPKYDKIFKPPG